MNLELREGIIPEQAEVKIEVSITAKLNVTGVTAQRKVSRLVLEKVGNLLYGERPNLVAGDRLLWRVPIWLGLPGIGPVGQAGAIDVDAQTGEMLFTPELLDKIAECADALARRSASTTR
jgi:hypothetical protein